MTLMVLDKRKMQLAAYWLENSEKSTQTIQGKMEKKELIPTEQIIVRE